MIPTLSDSGGQYFDGTCDTTRTGELTFNSLSSKQELTYIITVHFGFPTNEQMEAYTRVLQGHVRTQDLRKRLLVLY